MVTSLTEVKNPLTEDSQIISVRGPTRSLFTYDHQTLSPQSRSPINQFMFTSTSSIPQQKFTLSMAVSSNTIKDVFCNVALRNNFVIIEREQTTATAVSKTPFKLKDLLTKCLSSENQKKRAQSTALRIIIGLNEKQCKRTVLIKGLYGDVNQMKAFIKNFGESLEKQLKFVGKTYSFIQEATQLKNQSFSISEDEEYEENNYETSSYYQFHKILSQESYSLGKEVSNFVKNFNQQYRSVEESADLIPAPLESVKTLIDDTVQTLFSDFNFGKQSTEKMMMHCRPAVEKFIFGKLHSKLISFYNHKYKEEDQEFIRKREMLNKVNIFEHLELKQKFRLCNLEEPYHAAINEFSKLENQWNPKDKLACIMNTNGLTKTAVIDFWKGLEELQSMDDLLPILIFILCKSRITHLASEIYYLLDFVRGNQKYEAEQMHLINFEAGMKYVSSLNEQMLEEKTVEKGESVKQ